MLRTLNLWKSNLFCFFLRSKNHHVTSSIKWHPDSSPNLNTVEKSKNWLTKFYLLSEVSLLIWSQPWNTLKQKGSSRGSCRQLRWEWLMEHSLKYSYSEWAQYKYFKSEFITKKAFIKIQNGKIPKETYCPSLLWLFVCFPL